MLFTVGGMALGGWLAGALYDLTGDYTASIIAAVGFNVLNLGIAALLIARDRWQPAGGSGPAAGVSRRRRLRPAGVRWIPPSRKLTGGAAGAVREVVDRLPTPRGCRIPRSVRA